MNAGPRVTSSKDEVDNQIHNFFLCSSTCTKSALTVTSETRARYSEVAFQRLEAVASGDKILVYRELGRLS